MTSDDLLGLRRVERQLHTAADLYDALDGSKLALRQYLSRPYAGQTKAAGRRGDYSSKNVTAAGLSF